MCHDKINVFLEKFKKILFILFLVYLVCFDAKDIIFLETSYILFIFHI